MHARDREAWGPQGGTKTISPMIVRLGEAQPSEHRITWETYVKGIHAEEAAKQTRAQSNEASKRQDDPSPPEH